MSHSVRSHRRHRNKKRHAAPPGSPPGILIADPEAPRPVIHAIAFGPDSFTDTEVRDPDTVRELLEKWPVTWVNVEGLGDATVIGRLGEIFGLHRLALEDVLHVNQRAKLEDFTNHFFIVTRMVRACRPIETEQVSLFFGPRFVLTFQEGHPGDAFQAVRARIRENRGRIRSCASDFLVYALLDAVIDGYFPVLEQFGEYLESLEDDIAASATTDALGCLHDAKHELRALRRAMWPHRELFNTLIRDESPLISAELRPYLRDCYDHTVRIIELIETHRELCADLMDLYLSTVSTRMNEIMKVLTIITTLFMPLSFIAGVYGMNFNTQVSHLNMPELNWVWGYPFALALMVLVVIAFYYFFWRKGWLKALSVSRRVRPREPDAPAAPPGDANPPKR